MEALADMRRQAVLSQVAHELDVWDGSAKSEKGQSVASVDILLEFPNKRAVLKYLAKCPDGFPRCFETQGFRLHSAGGGWYEPISVKQTDGASLLDGFVWECANSDKYLGLRRSPAQVIAFVTKDSQEYGSALVSNTGLQVGVKCAVMCIEALASITEEYLANATGRPCRPSRPPGFPDKWVLFSGVTIRTAASPPPGLEPLSPDSTIQILCSGGLKVGNAYLKGAPPRILVSGLPATRPTVSVDGNPADLDTDGYLTNAIHLFAKGTHTIEVGPRSKMIEIVEADLAHNLVVAPRTQSPSAKQKFRTRVALPPGLWQVIGARIGEIGQRHATNSVGSLYDCSFQPVWAVNCENRRKPMVVYLFPETSNPETLSRRFLVKLKSQKKIRLLARRWACAIRFANHPKLQVSNLAGVHPQESTLNLWLSFKHSADQIARTLRRQ
jgi:hypothetical protein